MATVYSGWSNGWKPSGAKAYRYYRTRLDYWESARTDTTITYSACVYLEINKPVTVSSTYYHGGLNLSGTTASGKCQTKFNDGKGATTVLCVGTISKVFTRGTSNTTANITGTMKCSAASWTGMVVSASVNVSIPARTSYAVSYNANGGENPPATQTKYYDTALTLSTAQPTKQNWQFDGWNTNAEGTGTHYNSGATYTANAGATLYAEWSFTNPPTFDATEVVEEQGYDTFIKWHTTAKVDISNLHIEDGREIDSITMKIGDDEYDVTGQYAEGDFSLTAVPNSVGSLPVIVEIVDDTGAVTSKTCGTIEVEAPMWTTIVECDTLPPETSPDGFAKMEVYAHNGFYWEEIGKVEVLETEDGWSFPVTLGEDFASDPHSETPNFRIKAEYSHVDFSEKETVKAFFNTTRNANFSTGISNTVFISGCLSTNYSSRVWWSYVNNPLYFPDVNYVEVGSNDTSVMGLCKVGDYLGAVKQSKTTDTAIFLLYPTSFDDDTTYAVKQGVQGVGALSKYTFNILGDETLFLSPNGVVAIVPNQDEEHKVQNRSFFIDGRLLKDDVSSAYSFVYEGMYYLAVDGKCYVLDGNQRNSWGNDKTNLVYECYLLENIPADCFMKYNDELWFSNPKNVCRFRTEEPLYIDGYDIESGDVDVPVYAKWSTILDDDGALHFYKTMQKKGNLVSIFPQVSKYTTVSVRKDSDDPVEIQRTFSQNEDVPNELYINKKFKKYKRLQFIVENNPVDDEGNAYSEGFGIDMIVKNYSIGNYAKK